MKFIKWKSLLLTCSVCILSIIPGLILWDKLPEKMAIHFDIHNNPDNFASKPFAVFAMPLLMVLLQIFCCFVNDINAHKYGERKKFTALTKWIIPVMTVILQIVTITYNIGYNLDIRKIATLIVGAVLILIGNYLPKFDYIKNYDVTTEKARKINRFIGFETVFMGLLFIISIFMPPIATMVCIILLIPYSLIAAIYGIIKARK